MSLDHFPWNMEAIGIAIDQLIDIIFEKDPLFAKELLKYLAKRDSFKDASTLEKEKDPDIDRCKNFVFACTNTQKNMEGNFFENNQEARDLGSGIYSSMH